MLKKITAFTLFVLITFSLTQSIYSAASETECSVPVSPYGVTAASGQREGIVNDRQKRIALTFDDGPHSKYTAEILDILKEYHVHATFFVVGSNVRAYPELVVREISEGHEVGNHTDTHPCAVNKLNKSSLLKELTDAENAIYEVSDYKMCIRDSIEGIKKFVVYKNSNKTVKGGFKSINKTYGKRDTTVHNKTYMSDSLTVSLSYKKNYKVNTSG